MTTFFLFSKKTIVNWPLISSKMHATISGCDGEIHKIKCDIINSHSTKMLHSFPLGLSLLHVTC